MKRAKVEFHWLRYPPNFRKIPRLSRACVERLYAEVHSRRNSGGKEAFLRWFAENKADLESPMFKTFYAARQKQKQAQRILFHNLRSISEHYTVSLGLLGGWLSFLNRNHNDCEETIQLVRLFLLEIAIFESIFAGAYASLLGSVEFLDWVERNPRFRPCTAEDDKPYRLNATWAGPEVADEFIAQAKLRVKREDLSTDHINLKREEKARLSQPNFDLGFDRDRSSIIQEHIAQDMRLNENPPLSIEGITNTLKRWDDAGRHLAWAPLTVRKLQETERLMTRLHQIIAENRTQEDEDYAEILWSRGEQF